MLKLYGLDILGGRHAILSVPPNAIVRDMIESWAMARGPRAESGVPSIPASVVSSGLESRQETRREAPPGSALPTPLVPRFRGGVVHQPIRAVGPAVAGINGPGDTPVWVHPA
jgi:hypothetical protein